MGLEQADDRAIWHYAIANDSLVNTRDADFLENEHSLWSTTQK
ncbi:MAG: DUF5615 family PIN-like protein [Methylobacter sp.]